MLNIEGAKMSKSLGNYRTVVEMLDEHPDNGRAFRLLVLQTHYRKTMEVNADLMASARAACQRLDALARRLSAVVSAESPPRDGDSEPRSRVSVDTLESPGATERGSIVVAEGDLEEFRPDVEEAVKGFAARGVASRQRDRFCAAMDHDLGTPEAVAVMFDTLRRANAAFDEASDGGPVFATEVIEWAGALGITVEAVKQASDGDAAIEGLVARRQAAREAKDWATADALRDELSALGVVVEDTPAGPTWHRA